MDAKGHPCPIATGLYATDPLHHSNPHAYQAWIDAGAADWKTLVQARYQELHVGGYFVCTVASAKAMGDYPWSRVGYLVYQGLCQGIRRNNHHNSSPIIIQMEDLSSCVLPCCWRTESQVRAGFDPKQWKVHVCDFYETQDPLHRALEPPPPHDDKDQEDAVKNKDNQLSAMDYAMSVVQAWKAVGHATLAQALRQAVQERQRRQQPQPESFHDDNNEEVQRAVGTGLYLLLRTDCCRSRHAQFGCRLLVCLGPKTWRRRRIAIRAYTGG